MKKAVSQILAEISKLKTRDARIRALQQNNDYAIRTVLQGNFDPRIRWLLPEGSVPYKKNDLPDLESVFYAEARKLYLFVEGGNKDLSAGRREQLFIEMMEQLDKRDAAMLEVLKDKRLEDLYPGIDRDVVMGAFPGLIASIEMPQAPPKSTAKRTPRTPRSRRKA